MNRLLQRQIRKYLEDTASLSSNQLEFLKAVERSYENYEEQLEILHKTIVVSSEELFEANRKLEAEAVQQRKLIKSLNETIRSLRPKQKEENQSQLHENGKDLMSLIEDQAAQLIEIQKDRIVLMKDLEKRNQDLNDFAQIVSHDLKSPLRSINAIVSWLQEDYATLFDEEATTHFTKLLGKVEKMELLIDGILKYSTIDKVEKIRKKVDLNLILRAITEIIHIPKHIKITVKNELPILFGDSFRLQQLFQNLIDNAILNCDKVEGSIEIDCVSFDAYWQFLIKDNGKGIPEQYHEKIFKIFQSLDESKHATGMGLSIAKKIVNFYEGNIWLESEVGKGTTFYFTIRK